MAVNVSSLEIQGRLNARISQQSLNIIQTSSDRDHIGSKLSRTWDKIADWFCGTNRVEAKQLLFDIYSNQLSANDTIKAFEQLKSLAGAAYKDRFSVEHGLDNNDASFVLRIGDADSPVLEHKFSMLQGFSSKERFDKESVLSFYELSNCVEDKYRDRFFVEVDERRGSDLCSFQILSGPVIEGKRAPPACEVSLAMDKHDCGETYLHDNLVKEIATLVSDCSEYVDALKTRMQKEPELRSYLESGVGELDKFLSNSKSLPPSKELLWEPKDGLSDNIFPQLKKDLNRSTYIVGDTEMPKEGDGFKKFCALLSNLGCSVQQRNTVLAICTQTTQAILLNSVVRKNGGSSGTIMGPAMDRGYSDSKYTVNREGANTSIEVSFTCHRLLDDGLPVILEDEISFAWGKVGLKVDVDAEGGLQIKDTYFYTVAGPSDDTLVSSGASPFIEIPGNIVLKT